MWEPFTSMHKQAKINALGRVRQDMSIEKLSELVIDKSIGQLTRGVTQLTRARYKLL